MGTEYNQYNKFTNFPKVAYNCVTYLMNNEEILWKLLKYNTSDAWDKINLNKTEKGVLIYGGQPNETDYRVFLDIGADSSWNIEACILRVSPLDLIPGNYVYGEIYIGFEIYCHYRINHLSNYQTRVDLATQRIIEVMNGAEIADLGRLYFDKMASNACKSIPMGQIPYKGRATIFSNNALG